ncbi:MAG: hypothetical protein ABI068_12380, partial [Ktedonobacterales bacterium]
MNTHIGSDGASARRAPHSSKTSGAARRLPLVVAIPLLTILALILSTSVVFASGKGPALVVTPDNGPVGTHLSLNGSSFHPGDTITVGYTTGTCSPSVTTISGATGTVGS